MHGAQVPRFSLVLCTLGRSEEPARFLESLDAQHFRDFELIVVDQNHDDRVARLLEAHPRITAVRLQSVPGLSRARNVALPHARGEVVAFPDDDCAYPRGLLGRVAAFFDRVGHLDGVTGRALTPDGRETSGRWRRGGGWLHSRNVLGAHVSSTIFLRRRAVEGTGGFDDVLGVGAGTRWGAGEETDYLLRALRGGFRVYYEPRLVVHHPRPGPPFDARQRERARSYGRGLGHVLRRHGYPSWWGPYWCARPLASAAVALARRQPDRARVHLAHARGRLEGWSGR